MAVRIRAHGFDSVLSESRPGVDCHRPDGLVAAADDQRCDVVAATTAWWHRHSSRGP